MWRKLGNTPERHEGRIEQMEKHPMFLDRKTQHHRSSGSGDVGGHIFLYCPSPGPVTSRVQVCACVSVGLGITNGTDSQKWSWMLNDIFIGLPPVLKCALSLLGRRSTGLYLKWCNLHPSFGKIPLPSHRIRILLSSTIRAITDSTPKFWTSQWSYSLGSE